LPSDLHRVSAAGPWETFISRLRARPNSKTWPHRWLYAHNLILLRIRVTEILNDKIKMEPVCSMFVIADVHCVLIRCTLAGCCRCQLSFFTISSFSLWSFACLPLVIRDARQSPVTLSVLSVQSARYTGFYRSKPSGARYC